VEIHPRELRAGHESVHPREPWQLEENDCFESRAIEKRVLCDDADRRWDGELRDSGATAKAV
jgi:hypothetical protein